MGHNSRTCSNKRGDINIGGKIRLFGVQIEASSSPIMSMKKSLSTGSFQSSSSSLTSSSNSHVSWCLSHSLLGRTHQRKKGKAWTEEEHKRFIRGLEKLGKGDWRGISNKFVRTKSPTQVASHAQKYFLRLMNLPKKKKHNRARPTRHFVFDLVENKNVALEQAKERKNPKPIESCIQFDVQPKSTASSKQPNHEYNDPHLTNNLWLQGLNQPTNPNQSLNLELTLDTTKAPLLTPQQCHLSLMHM